MSTIPRLARLSSAGSSGMQVFCRDYRPAGLEEQPGYHGAREAAALLGISSGNVDSMVNNLTPNLKRRSSDVYSPGGRTCAGRTGQRWCTRTSSTPRTRMSPLSLAGRGESPAVCALRLLAGQGPAGDPRGCPGTLLIYGMGERQIVEIAQRLLRANRPGRSAISGGLHTRWKCRMAGCPARGDRGDPFVYRSLVRQDRVCKALAHYRDRTRSGDGPWPSRTEDRYRPEPPGPAAHDPRTRLYELPLLPPGPSLVQKTGAGARTVRFSMSPTGAVSGAVRSVPSPTTKEGSSRAGAIDSIVREVTRMSTMPEFKGIVQDVGGPTANMYAMACPKWEKAGACPDKSCSPACPTLDVSHTKLCELLRRVSEIPGVKKGSLSDPGSATISCACRDQDAGYLRQLAEAPRIRSPQGRPEHVSAGSPPR